MKNNTAENNDIRNIRKKAEFLAFMSEIEKGAIGNWIDIAHALGVDKDTITEWKKLPEAQIAIKKGISNALTNMQEVGSKDWRMWESKLKLLGLSPILKQDIRAEIDIPNPILGAATLNDPATKPSKKESS